jgi:phenylacetyl-CoA:acceptor oxidoreductase 26-kDa subunit
VQGSPRLAAIVLALALVSLGLLCVWAEIGRPWRAINVMFNPRSSWMSREAALAPLLVGSGALWLAGPAWAGVPTALLALGFLYCQARILQAAKGIPAWREPLTVPLLVATGLAEGAGLFWLLAPWWGQGSSILWAAFGVLLAIRFTLGVWWYARLSRQLRPRPLQAVNQAGHAFNGGSLLPMAIVLGLLMLPPAPGWAVALQVLAGVLAALGGAAFKFMLITRAGFNQGFALTHLPVRGVRS